MNIHPVLLNAIIGANPLQAAKAAYSAYQAHVSGKKTISIKFIDPLLDEASKALVSGIDVKEYNAEECETLLICLDIYLRIWDGV
jgi:hypothetical protein